MSAEFSLSTEQVTSPPLLAWKLREHDRQLGEHDDELATKADIADLNVYVEEVRSMRRAVVAAAITVAVSAVGTSIAVLLAIPT